MRKFFYFQKEKIKICLVFRFHGLHNRLSRNNGSKQNIKTFYEHPTTHAKGVLMLRRASPAMKNDNFRTPFLIIV